MLAPGSLLGGRFRLVARLGQGGMGEVWEGVQEDLGRRVAIKVLLPSLMNEPELLARFQREARAAAGLAHPNIVSVTDFVSAPGEPAFLVMELLSGRSLARAMDEGPMNETRVAFIATQVLAALDAAHRAGIVHRDIKPDNIFLTSISGVDDIAKVLDFGIAKLYGEGEAAKLTMTGAVMGTPQYMSPEQARGRTIDARTDLFALGTCMYQALTGRLPFHGGSFNALLFAIAEEPAPPISTLRGTIDPRFAAVVERALAKDPNARFASAEEMRAALAPWVRGGTASTLASGATVASLPAPALTPSAEKKRASGRAALFAAIALVGLAVLGGGIYAATRGHEDEKAPPAPPVAEKKKKKVVEQEEVAGESEEPAASAEPEPTAEPRPSASTPIATTASIKKAPSASAAPSAPLPPPRATGGKTATLSSISSGGVYDTATIRAAASFRTPDVNRCYLMAEFDPIDHQFVDWNLIVDATGKVVNHAPVGTSPRSFNLDLCMGRVFKMFVFGAPPKNGAGGTVRLGYTSRAPWNP